MLPASTKIISAPEKNGSRDRALRAEKVFGSLFSSLKTGITTDIFIIIYILYLLPAHKPSEYPAKSFSGPPPSPAHSTNNSVYIFLALRATLIFCIWPIYRHKYRQVRSYPRHQNKH